MTKVNWVDGDYGIYEDHRFVITRAIYYDTVYLSMNVYSDDEGTVDAYEKEYPLHSDEASPRADLYAAAEHFVAEVLTPTSRPSKL